MSNGPGWAVPRPRDVKSGHKRLRGSSLTPGDNSILTDRLKDSCPVALPPPQQAGSALYNPIAAVHIMAETPEPVAPFPFLRLPRELRDVVYSLYFKPADRLLQNHSLEAKGYYGGLYKFDFDLVHVNRQVRS